MKSALLLLVCSLSITVLACETDSGGGDTTIAIVDPADQALLNGTVTITVEVEGPADQLVLRVGEQDVETFAIAGPQTDLSWDSTLFDDGLHEITVAAMHKEKQAALSAPISLETDNTPPEISVVGLERPYVYKDSLDWTVEIEEPHGYGTVGFEIDGVEIDTSDQEPHQFSWSAAGYEEGTALEIGVTATDDLGNVAYKNLDGVVINYGQLLTFTDGTGNATFSIPETYTPGMEVHISRHWIMPAGIYKMIGAVQWEEPGWYFELALGEGICPHSGTMLSAQISETGQIVTIDDIVGTYSEVEHFIHIGEAPMFDLTTVIGESVPFWALVAIYPEPV